MNLTIKSLPENVAFLRNVIAAFCVGNEPTVDTLSDIKTAVSEAITNAVVHGYKGKDGDIYLDVKIENNCLYIKITDKGAGIEDIDKAMEDFFTTDTEEERSGLGFTIMKTYMDSLRVESKLGAGTTVYMTKSLVNA